jgi:hypothetical protein
MRYLALLIGLILAGCGDGRPPATHAAPAAKPYPLQTCVVSNEPLGAMGKPTSVVHEGQEIKFCCAGCEKDFWKDPAKFMKKVAP